MKGDVGVDESWVGWSMAQTASTSTRVYVHACIVNHVLEEGASLDGKAVTGDGRCQSDEGGQYHEASGLATLGHSGGPVEVAGPHEHHLWVLQGLGTSMAEDVGNMVAKLLGARASSGAAGKIRHNRSKIENFIEVKSNRAAELSPTAGAQPAALRDTKKGAGVSIGHRGYSTVGEWNGWLSPTGTQEEGKAAGTRPPSPSLAS